MGYIFAKASKWWSLDTLGEIHIKGGQSRLKKYVKTVFGRRFIVSCIYWLWDILGVL